jgi:hypothetical protein
LFVTVDIETTEEIVAGNVSQGICLGNNVAANITNAVIIKKREIQKTYIRHLLGSHCRIEQFQRPPPKLTELSKTHHILSY